MSVEKMSREADSCQLGTVGPTKAYPQSDRTWVIGRGLVKEGRWSHDCLTKACDKLGFEFGRSGLDQKLR